MRSKRLPAATFTLLFAISNLVPYAALSSDSPGEIGAAAAARASNCVSLANSLERLQCYDEVFRAYGGGFSDSDKEIIIESLMSHSTAVDVKIDDCVFEYYFRVFGEKGIRGFIVDLGNLEARSISFESWGEISIFHVRTKKESKDIRHVSGVSTLSQLKEVEYRYKFFNEYPRLTSFYIGDFAPAFKRGIESCQ